MNKPKSAASDREIAAAEKYTDERTAARLRARSYGDALDRVGVREGMSDAAQAAALSLASVLLVVSAVFAWQAGAVVFPSLEVLGFKVGGVPLIINELIFIVVVFLARTAPGGFNLLGAWSLLSVVTFTFALFCIFTSQTTAADKVRETVDHKARLERELGQLRVEIEASFIPSRGPATAALEESLNEAVGSGLNTISETEAARMCADEPDFMAKLACRQKILRDSVNCAQDMKPLVRDATCTPAASFRAQLKRIDDMEAALQAKRDLMAEKTAELEALPAASNRFVVDIAALFKMALDDAQARTYIFLGLLFLLTPAIIFALTLERRELPDQNGEV